LNKLINSCIVPLVRAGSKADERSIWGIVVDPNDNPVAGALIECRGVRTPGGGGIGTPTYKAYKILTDKDGRFYMYFPIEKDSNKHGNLIPLASKYPVQIEAPKALGLNRYSGVVNSGEETTVTMRTVRRSHNFVFEDEFGPVADPNWLKHIKLSVEYEGMWSRLSYSEWLRLNKGEFLPGTYHATADWDNKHYISEPVQLGVETPQTVVFKLKEIKEIETIYQGRVIHGITSEPMSGAFVIAGGVGLKDFSIFTPKQWQAMHTLPANPELDAPALVPLHKICNFKKIARTDPSGWFQMSLPPHSVLIGITAFEQNHLGINHSWDIPTHSIDSVVKVPTLKLFPSATLVIEPNVPDKSGDEDIRLRFRMHQENNPSWLTDFLKCFRGNPNIVHKRQLQLNKPNSIHIPAGLKMTARILYSRNSQWCPIIIDNIQSRQGQIVNMGRRDFQPALKVALKVVDSKGEPVEGVGVSCLDEAGLFWGQTIITDEDGVAIANVPPGSKGEFVISYYDSVTKTHLREGITYEVAAEEDAGKQFTLQISDEMLYQLFK
jgi:hypothetical protein